MLLFNESTRKEVALAEPLIKMSTDSGEVSARHPAGRPFNYQPLFTPVYAVNHLPSASMDPALWRRLVIVPFHYRFPDDQKDPTWRDRILKEEGAGILNWIIEGANAYLADGLQVPESITDFTEGCKSEMDAISTFIEDTYFKVPTEKIKASDMRRQFITWCIDNGYKQNYSAQNFRRELEDRGYVVQKGTGNYRYVHGLSDSPAASVKKDPESKFFNTEPSDVTSTLSDTFRALRGAEAE
jgi:putative DNA primase/helicase